MLCGEIDMAVEEELRSDFERIIAAPGVHLLIDAAAVTFIDSTGVRLIVDAHLALEAKGRHLMIINMPAQVRKSFEILGLDDLFRCNRELIDPEVEQLA
jgi:anti-anti-sigma factor